MNQANITANPTGYGQLPADNRPTILVTNDDGYDAPGIAALVESMRGLARIVVVAPDSPRSGFSASFTCTRPLTLRRISADADVMVYACSGTPVDCVKLAIHRFFSQQPPSLLVSGINHGGNDSICIMYSGTMGAVLEGVVIGVPAIGFSLLDHRREADFCAAQPYIRSMVSRVLQGGMPHGVALNVNIPAVPHLQGVRVCRMAEGLWHKEFLWLEGHEDEGTATFQTTGEYLNCEPEALDTDRYWLERDYISVVPVGVDYTRHGMLAHFKSLEQ